MRLITYLGDVHLKTAFLAEITNHEEANAFIKGTYGRMNGAFRGCAIGCSLHSLNVLQGTKGEALAARTDDHHRYEAELGLPTWFAYLEDHIFETLSDQLAVTWPRRLAEAIPVGAVVDDTVLARILHWCLADAEFGVRYATDDKQVRSWIDAVAVYIDADSRGGATAEQRRAAARIARVARAAWVARDARAAWAARDAWDAWVARAARAAWATWDAWDAWAARDAWDARVADLTNSSRGKADAFSQALSEFVLDLVRRLPIGVVTA